eukprot:scaffold319180_cov19-Prasinocladus_malaysianus.AAC.1
MPPKAGNITSTMMICGSAAAGSRRGAITAAGGAAKGPSHVSGGLRGRQHAQVQSLPIASRRTYFTYRLAP